MYYLQSNYGYVEAYGKYGVVFTPYKAKAMKFTEDDANETRRMLEKRHLVYKFELEKAD